MPVGNLQNDRSQRAALESLLDGTSSSLAAKQNATIAANALGPGSVARSVEAILADTASVKNFGAAGDGSTDDTAALAALNLTNTTLSFVPGATYILDSFTPLAGTRINLNGATLKLKASSAGSLIRVNAANVEIVGPGTLDGNLSGQSSLRDCIQILYGGDNLTVREVAITSAKRAGIYCVEGQAGRLSGLKVRSVSITSCAQYGLYAGDMDDISSSGLRVTNIGTTTAHHGITLKTCKRADFDKPYVYLSAGIGFEIAGGEFNVVNNARLRDNNINASIAAGAVCCGFDGGISDLRGITASYCAEMSAVSGSLFHCFYKNMLMYGANNEGGGNTTTRCVNFSHGSNNIWYPVVSGCLLQGATRNFTASSGTRRLQAIGNVSVDPTSYHFDFGGQSLNCVGNFTYGGTKAFALSSTTKVVIVGHYFDSLTEDGILEIGTCTLTMVGTCYYGVTDKLDGIPGMLALPQDGDVPDENMTGIFQAYAVGGYLRRRNAAGTDAPIEPKFMGTVTWSGSGATLAATVTGVAAADIVWATIRVKPTQAAYLVRAVPSTNTITFELSAANTSNDAQISYLVFTP